LANGRSTAESDRDENERQAQADVRQRDEPRLVLAEAGIRSAELRRWMRSPSAAFGFMWHVFARPTEVSVCYSGFTQGTERIAESPREAGIISKSSKS
jgi:hypothetical protein